MVSELDLTLMLNGASPQILSIAYYISLSVYALIPVAVILAVRKRGLNSGFYAAAVISAIALLNFMLKLFFNEPRPSDSSLMLLEEKLDPSFPSGHSSAGFGASSISGYNMLYIWAILIAVSRLVLGVHYLSDVIAGAVMGYLIGKTASVYERRVIEMFLNKRHIFETRRQLVHGIFGIVVALFVFIAPEDFAKAVLLISLISVLFISFLKKWGAYIPLVSEILDIFERKKDMRGFPLKGTIFFLFGAFASLVLYEKNIASASILILALGDSFSTLIGKPYGRTKHFYNKKKSVEGSAAGFAVAFAGALFFVSPKVALVGAFAGMLIESLDLKAGSIAIDDNLTIPVICGAAMSLVLMI